MSTQILDNSLLNSTTELEAINIGLKPDPILSLLEWSDAYRVLSSTSSSESGKYRSSRTPYIREVLECLSNGSAVDTVVLMFGAQLGKTESGLNWLGYIADAAPGPCMIVQPTLDMAKRFSKQRLDPLFADTPRLAGKLRPSRERDSGNSQLSKIFDGGVFLLAGSNSAASLRSAPVRYLFLDEVDAYGLTHEGSPIELAIARTKTFARRKILITSTPTISGRSNIEELYHSGDQRQYHVPCPHCDAFQVLRWESVVWEKDKPDTAHFVCSVNGCRIEEHQKTKMLERGRWVSTCEAPRNPKTASFHLSSLYAPVGWFGLADAVRLFLRSKSDPERLRAFKNTYLAETWKETTNAPDWERLYRRREEYAIGSVPDGVVFLTAGADVQKDRIEIEVVGWGRDKQSWSVEYIVLIGDTAAPQVWRELDRVMEREWVGKAGVRLPIRLLGIDTGYQTNIVYAWARKYPSNRVAAMKGSDTLSTAVGIPKAVDISIGGRSIKRGLRLWPVGVSLIKSELFTWLGIEAPLKDGDPFQPGYCHFPQYDEEYFKMLTSEQLVVRYVKGFRKYEWEKLRERNESLDCRTYARASASIVGMDRFTADHWDQIDPFLGLDDAPNDDPAPAPQAPRPHQPKAPERRKSSYW